MLNERRVTLVMLSGGLDSTYVLAKLLADTDDEILVHHIELLNESRRHVPEAKAVKAIVSWCRENYRPFSFSRSAIDHRGFQFHGFDLVAAGFEAGMVSGSFKLATGGTVDRWVIGRSAEDADIHPRRLRDAATACTANCPHDSAPDMFELPKLPKQEQTSFLPRALFDLIWYCRRPVPGDGAFVTCGACAACKLMREIRHPDAAPA